MLSIGEILGDIETHEEREQVLAIEKHVHLNFYIMEVFYLVENA